MVDLVYLLRVLTERYISTLAIAALLATCVRICMVKRPSVPARVALFTCCLAATGVLAWRMQVDYYILALGSENDLEAEVAVDKLGARISSGQLVRTLSKE